MSPTRRSNHTSDRLTHVSSHVGLAACCGLGTDQNRDALFRQRLLPPPMNNNMRNYGP